MHATHGIKVLRVFAFSNGLNISNIATYYAIQPVLGHFSELPLRRLDFILATGAKYGLRFIMVLGALSVGVHTHLCAGRHACHRQETMSLSWVASVGG